MHNVKRLWHQPFFPCESYGWGLAGNPSNWWRSKNSLLLPTTHIVENIQNIQIITFREPEKATSWFSEITPKTLQSCSKLQLQPQPQPQLQPHPSPKRPPLHCARGFPTAAAAHLRAGPKGTRPSRLGPAVPWGVCLQPLDHRGSYTPHFSTDASPGLGAPKRSTLKNVAGFTEKNVGSSLNFDPATATQRAAATCIGSCGGHVLKDSHPKCLSRGLPIVLMADFGYPTISYIDIKRKQCSPTPH